MIALDSNVLVYAHRAGSPQHALANQIVRSLVEGDVPWALPFTVLGEYLRVVTHASARPPTPLHQAIDDIDKLLASPSVRLLRPESMGWRTLRATLLEAAATGNLVHDGQMIAICIEHGVDVIISEDRGLRKFRGLRVLTLEEAT